MMVRLLFMIALLLVGPALAAPPPNADPQLAPWFQGLRQPGTGYGCCSIADCRPTDARETADGHFEALLDPENYPQFAAAYGMKREWIAVPDDKILQRTDNPVGRAVMCWSPGRGVLCFVRGTEA